MKKLFFLLFIVILLFSGLFSGCRKPELLTMKISWTETTNEVTNFSILNEETVETINLDIAPERRIYFLRTPIIRAIAILTAKVYNELGEEIEVEESLINWTVNFNPESLNATSGKTVLFEPNNAGKYIVTAFYQDLQAIIEIISYKSFTLIVGENNWINSYQGIVFSTDTGTDILDEADFYISNPQPGPPGTIDFYAPNGMTYTDKICLEFVSVNEVSNLNYDNTVITLTPEERRNKTFIIKTQEGGYAKLAMRGYSQGNNYYTITLGYEYSENGIFITW